MQTNGVTKIEDLEFASPPPRGSVYEEVFNRMRSLKPGQAFTVPVPKEIDVRTMHNRLNSAIKRNPVQPPEGCRFEKRSTENGDAVAICCVRLPVDEPEKPRKRK